MAKFAIGDRVRCLVDTGFARKGDTGTVKESSFCPNVEWDGKKWKETKHGWYAVLTEDIELIKGDTMDKLQAIKRLDAIEAEAKELRKVIEGKVVYNTKKIYVGIWLGRPFILQGVADENNHFFSLESSCCFHDRTTTGQSAIDSMEKDGGTIHEFTDTRTALQFFLDNLK